MVEDGATPPLIRTYFGPTVGWKNVEEESLFGPPFVTPEDFGADGTAAGDTAGIIAATATGAPVYFLPRVYLLKETTDGNHGIVPTVPFTWIGAGIDKTILRVSAPTNWTPIITPPFVTPVTDIWITGITFDGNGNLPSYPISNRYPQLTAIMEITATSHCLIENCKFTGLNACGLLLNDGTNITVKDCYFERAAVNTIPNFGLYMWSSSAALAPPSNNAALNNHFVNTIMSVTGSHSCICNNNFNNWGFAFAIALNLDDHHWLVDGNVCHGGGNLPIDFFGIPPGGIEAWAEDSTYSNNVIDNCPGSGFGGGPRRSLVIGNHCDNNGQNTSVGVIDRSGINTFWSNATHNGDDCVFTGNCCRNTGGNTTQLYGIYIGGVGGIQTGIVIEGNYLGNNTVGPVGVALPTSSLIVRDNFPPGESIQNGNYSMQSNDEVLTFNAAGPTTLTLLPMENYHHKELTVRTIFGAVISNIANVTPLVGGASGTAILPATPGKWAVLRSNGSQWTIIQAN